MIAQQQAHFIAQHSLMARQAAAAAAAAQQQEQYLYQHLAMHPTHSTGANSAVVSQAPPTYATATTMTHPTGSYSMTHTHAPPPTMANMNQGAGGIPSHLAAGGVHAAQYPQFVFMPRHMVGPGGFPVGFMPPGMSPMHFPGAATAAAATGGLAQTAIATPTGIAHPGTLSHSAAAANAQQQRAAALTANAASAMLPTSIKRSYDNAFRNDQSQLTATTGTKRAFHGGNQAAAAAAATAALYTPYYHPHI
ncbi:RNA-binding protein fusilli-like [Armigeres subalbatus]|uniref:RNA-binding protein fusilli-like n=1 Tax=Armigeres subalbatus TaxID=124917 RepID=UPI002ED5B5CC